MGTVYYSFSKLLEDEGQSLQQIKARSGAISSVASEGQIIQPPLQMLIKLRVKYIYLVYIFLTSTIIHCSFKEVYASILMLRFLNRRRESKGYRNEYSACYFPFRMFRSIYMTHSETCQSGRYRKVCVKLLTIMYVISSTRIPPYITTSLYCNTSDFIKC
jgi:hypothetical protein